MSHKRRSPLPINEGGTQKQSFTANTVICGGTTSTNPLQNVADTGTTFQILGSQGAGALPQWITLSNATFFEPLASDPSSPTVGQVWYNTTSQQFKGAIDGGGGSATWVVKTSMNTARRQLAGCGSSGADVISVAGLKDSGTGGQIQTNEVERYDGTGNSWTNKTSISAIRQFLAGAGTAVDGLICGGEQSPGTGIVGTVERYDGGANTWATKTSLNTARKSLAASGTAGDALSFGGSTGISVKTSELYDGSGDSWTNKSNMNVGLQQLAGSAITSSPLAFGGSGPGLGVVYYKATAQSYDGTSNMWSTKASLSVARKGLAGAGNSNQDSLAFGGESVTGLTEIYDGISNTWTTVDALNTPRFLLSGSGTSTDALSYGGDLSSGSITATTERYEGGGGVSIVVFDITAV